MESSGSMAFPLANSVRRIAAVAVVCLLGATMACAEPDDAEILSILDDMALEGDQFRAERLHELGLPGLCALLDRLLPLIVNPKLRGKFESWPWGEPYGEPSDDPMPDPFAGSND